MQDETTGRFGVVEVGGLYEVWELATAQALRYSYDRAAIPFANGNDAARWGNFYSARGFAQKMARLHPAQPA